MLVRLDCFACRLNFPRGHVRHDCQLTYVFIILVRKLLAMQRTRSQEGPLSEKKLCYVVRHNFALQRTFCTHLIHFQTRCITSACIFANGQSSLVVTDFKSCGGWQSIGSILSRRTRVRSDMVHGRSDSVGDGDMRDAIPTAQNLSRVPTTF